MGSKNNQTETIGNDQSLTVTNNQIIRIDNNQAVIVKGNQSLTVTEGNRIITLTNRNENKTLGTGSLFEEIKETRDSHAKVVQFVGDDNVILNVGKGTVVMSEERIELKFGSSSIQLTDIGIFLSATQIHLNKDKESVNHDYSVESLSLLMTIIKAQYRPRGRLPMAWKSLVKEGRT
ncbi:hypothetical protein RYD26_12140 [Pasteurellaceae bacterium LIM206]|nr:hypothetical protein [Pasteurellaceae bacterium LIM206]